MLLRALVLMFAASLIGWVVTYAGGSRGCGGEPPQAASRQQAERQAEPSAAEPAKPPAEPEPANEPPVDREFIPATKAGPTFVPRDFQKDH